MPGLGTHLLARHRHIPSCLNVLADSLSRLKPRVHGMAARSDSLQSSPSVTTDVVSRCVRDLSQYATPTLTLPVSRHECGRGRGAFPPMGVSGRDVRISTNSTVNSGTRQDQASSSQMFNLHTWTLCGLVTGDRDSLHALPYSWLRRFGFQLQRSMTENGPSTVLGVQIDRSILVISL